MLGKLRWLVILLIVAGVTLGVAACKSTDSDYSTLIQQQGADLAQVICHPDAKFVQLLDVLILLPVHAPTRAQLRTE